MKRLLNLLLLSATTIATTASFAQVEVRTKLFLEGPYSSNLNRHKDVTANWAAILQNNAAGQPYNVAPFNYAGTESVNPVIFGATAATTDIVDWVLVELKSNSGALVGKRAGFVLENGDVVDVDGSSPITFNVAAGNYYITVRHRNHLSLSTEQPVSIAATSSGYHFDFTIANDSQLYGASTSFYTSGATTLLLAGDANSNGVVRYNGPGNDRDAILNYLGGNEVGFVSGIYRTEDVNLDGIVRYNGPNNDRDALLSALDGNEVGYKSSSEISLPVTWGVITAFIKNSQLVVSWITESETNSKEFIVEGSIDGKKWHELGRVTTSNGNSPTPQRYNFANSSSSIMLGLSFAVFTLLNLSYSRKQKLKLLIILIFCSGITLLSYSCNKNQNIDLQADRSGCKFIRIAQVDIDGSKKYSKVVSVVNE